MKKNVEIMDNIDNFWLHMDNPTNLMIITGFMQFDKPLDFERLTETIKNRLLCYDRFKKRIVRPMTGVGNAVWELDPHFDLRSHLQRIALPSPGGKAELEEVLSDLSVSPLDSTKPPWQFHYIENYKNGGSVLFSRIHHCIADGIALVKLLLSMADETPDAQWSAVMKEKKREKEPVFDMFPPLESAFKKISRAKRRASKAARFMTKEIDASISNPLHFLERSKTVSKFILDTATVLSKIMLLPADRKTAFKGGLGVRKSLAWSEDLPLQDIKAVGKYFNATINDILVALVTGALRRYLQQCNNLVGDLDLRMAMPINIRPMDSKIELGNQFSLILVALPVHIDDPVLRIREVQRRIRDLKEAPDAAVAWVVLNALGVSSAKLAKTGATMFANKTTGVLSNVPGPRHALYFAGEEIKKIMFWVPRIGGLGIGISIISYNNRVSVGIATDTGLVKDPKTILENFVNEFRMLLGMYKAGKMEKDPLVINDRSMEADIPVPPQVMPATNVQAIRCKATTKSGKQCLNRAATNSMYCTIHLTKYEKLTENENKESSAG
ncbi:MAG: wax ester/triacylglycerol synthase family O-acyltransferase [Deltaproteobacteria bacterium]|nr:wax ester/triacylglycerol synthase family O-acyltransferase [Deltaproteobacteria bacterium]